MKFLIADDSPGNRRLLHASLESEGHSVVDAANGIEALTILEQEPVDAVISDILMPSMDGFRLCREIRRSAKTYRNIPLILYTATYDSPSDRVLADTVGADGYMLKPATVAELVGAVRQVLCKNTVRRAAGPESDEGNILERYNAVLVQKLEARTAELQESMVKLQAAHDEIVDLNRTLESRIAERTAELNAVNKELESFSYSVSHDLQAPLRRINGFVQLLRESLASKLDDDDLGMLKHVVDGTGQMGQLIEALLAFARTSRSEMHFAEVDLDMLVDSAIVDLSFESAGRAIEWSRSPLPKVRGDRTLLNQVVVNLLANALKYTRTRSKAVIEIGVREGRDNEVTVFIRDNGVGFDMRYASRLFGVFQRMHRPDEFEGTGIGLANARRIVTRHGGSIWADATPDVGATFYFSLPRS